MTIQANILALTLHVDTTEIDNAVDKAFRQISRIKKTTIVEDTDADLNEIAENYAIYLLDRKEKERERQNDTSVVVPPLLPEEIERQIQDHILKDVDTPQSIMSWSNDPPARHKSWTD